MPKISSRELLEWSPSISHIVCSLLPPAPCSTAVSTWKRGASVSWEETELFFSNKCLPEGSDGEKLVAVTLAFQGQKAPFVTQVHCSVILSLIKMVLNECLMTEHGVSADLETAN